MTKLKQHNIINRVKGSSLRSPVGCVGRCRHPGALGARAVHEHIVFKTRLLQRLSCGAFVKVFFIIKILTIFEVTDYDF